MPTLLERMEKLEKQKSTPPKLSPPPKPKIEKPKTESPQNEPPKAEALKIETPKTEVEEISIPYDKIAQNSSFQRAIIEILKMIFPEQFKSVNVRASKEVMTTQFNEKVNKINKMVPLMETINFGNVVKEMKENFKNGNNKPSQIK